MHVYMCSVCVHLLGTHLQPHHCLVLGTRSGCSLASQVVGSNMIYFPLTVLKAKIPLKSSLEKKKKKNKKT